MAIRKPFNFQKWIDEHRHLLKPPVGNKLVYEDADLIVMVVGGPNARKDYHYNEGEEFFYQMEGNIVVKIQEDGKAVEVPINEGDIFLLPAKVPHSPIRSENSVGLVIELKRKNLYATNTSVYQDVVSGSIVALWQNTSGRAEVVVDTGSTATNNRWGSFVFRGGHDTISTSHEIELIQYSFTSSTAKVY